MARAMPNARDYFDDGPRAARRTVSGGSGQGQVWVAQGFEDLAVPIM